MEKELLYRNLYRQIKSMDKNELSRTLNNIYEMGKELLLHWKTAIPESMECFLSFSLQYSFLFRFDCFLCRRKH